ncbi:Adaptive-response sensory-kinase SasA [Castellaniella defragrans]
MVTGTSPPPPKGLAQRLRLSTRLRIEWSILTLALSLLAGILTIGSGPLGIQSINRIAYDFSMQVSGGTRADPDIVIIAIDDSSLQSLGYWPWKRSVHAELLKHLGQARAVGMDILFSDAHHGDFADDVTLARAIAANGRVVLPEALSQDGKHLLRTLPPFAQAAAAIGRIDAEPDPDGILRRVELWRTPKGGTPLPHMSLQLAHMASGTPLKPGVPVEADVPTLINFTGPPRHYTIYPYSAVLRGEIPDSAFKNRIVLIGAWATGLGDQLPTAMGAGSMMGVEVLANTLQNIQSNLWIHQATWIPATLLNLLPLWVICAILRKASARTSTISVLIAIPVCFILDALSMHWLHYWVPPSGAWLAIVLSYPLWSWRNLEASLQYLDAELERLHIPAKAASPMAASTPWANTLPARATRLHQAVSYIQESARRREETLSFISHDMRAPQSTILAAIELRKQAPDQWPEADTLRDIAQQANATLDLASRFLQLARAESAVLIRKDCSLSQLCAEACSQIEPLADQHGVRLSCNAPDEAGIARVDRSLLSRALNNLLYNAVLYSPRGSTVECELRALDGGGWDIRVRDNGPGITPEQMPHLFTRYWRGRSDSADMPQGSGLGLAFVATVVRRHGGEIHCESTPGVGTQFTLHLPRTSGT